MCSWNSTCHCFPIFVPEKNDPFPILKILRSFNTNFHDFFCLTKKGFALNTVPPQHGSATSTCCNSGSSNGIYGRMWSNFKFTLKQYKLSQKIQEKLIHSDTILRLIARFWYPVCQLYCALPSWFKPYALNKQSVKCVKSPEKYHISSKSTSCMHCTINLDKSYRKTVGFCCVFFLLLCSKNMA